MQLKLKKCSVADLDQLVQISRTTFVDAFENQNDPENFKAYIDFAFSKGKLQGELKDANINYYFVYSSDVLAGYLKLNKNDAQTDIKLPEAIELERIYVLEAFQGKRIGEWLLNEVKKMASDKQKGFVWLGVWEKNTKAIRFYQKHGFSKFGSHPYFVGTDKQTDWLMRFDFK